MQSEMTHPGSIYSAEKDSEINVRNQGQSQKRRLPEDIIVKT
jgi:hypothetical protein